MTIYEHYGTHLDAPSFFHNKGMNIDEIPIERLIGKGVIINVVDKAKADPNYAVTVADLEEWEVHHDKIPQDSIVILNTGWYNNYPDYERWFGSDTTDIKTFNYPGYTFEACKFLVQHRQPSIVGTDAPAPDPAQPNNPSDTWWWPCHTYLAANDIPILKSVDNMDSIPEAGANIVVAPMKHSGGRGGPTRVYAHIPDDCNHGNDEE